MIFLFSVVIVLVLRWIEGKGLIDLGRWSNIVTITLGVIAILSLAFPTLDSPPVKSSETLTPTFGDAATIDPANTPTRQPSTYFYQIPINRIDDDGQLEGGLGLEPGLHDLLGIPFDIGWQATTQCDYLPNRPTQMSLDTFVPKPITVYILLNGTGANQKAGEQVGIIRLTFSDGWSSDTPVRFGVNIRNWALDRDPYAIVTTTSSSVLEALQEPVYLPPPEDKTVTGVMDVLTIPIATERQQAKLTGIEIVDTTFEETGWVDPCMHVSGITVEYLR